MADDTRRNNDKAFAGSQWDEAQPAYKPPENANLMPGGTQHTAGGSAEDVTLIDAAKTIKRDDWTKFPQKPCVKDSLLTGIGTGFAVGGARAIWRAPVIVSCNWAVGTFCLGSFAMYQYCQYQRLAEKEGMKRAIEIIDRKTLEKKQKEARMERARELRRQKKEAEQETVYANLKNNAEQDKQGKSWWKEDLVSGTPTDRIVHIRARLEGSTGNMMSLA